MARPNNAPDVFRAVAHPVRRRILDLLRNKPQTVGELHAQFRLGGSTFSEHLRALRAAGLVRQSKRGPRDRKSTRLNSSHVRISYAVFCLKKKKKKKHITKLHNKK